MELHAQQLCETLPLRSRASGWYWTVSQPAQGLFDAKLFTQIAASVGYSLLAFETRICCTGAVVYREAEPYQAELRQHATAFLRALQQAGFSLEGIVNGVPQEQYILALTSETCGRVQLTPHLLSKLIPNTFPPDCMCSAWTNDMDAKLLVKALMQGSCMQLAWRE